MPLLAILLSAALASAQAAQPAQAPVRIRSGDYAPESPQAVPVSEVAPPVALAMVAFDADRDGRTSRAELAEGLGRSFAAADSNTDGALGYIEYSGWALLWMGSQSALPGPFAIDADGDDRLSRPEMLNEFGRQFIRFDQNADGSVTRAELLTVRNPRVRPLRREQERQPIGRQPDRR